MLPRAQCSREGQGEGKQISLAPWPWEECWCHGRLCHRVHAVIVAVLGWQGPECLAMAETKLYSRYPVPLQIGEIWDHISVRADVGSAHGAESKPAWLAIPSACCGARPAQQLWLQPCVRGYPVTLLRGEIQKGEEPPHHTHTGKAEGWGWTGDWPENTQKSRGREEAAPCSSALVLAGLLGPEQDPGTGSDVCTGSKAKAEPVITVTREGGP